MTRIFFACLNCKKEEIKRAKKEMQKANEGTRRFFSKYKPIMKQENYMREASELILLKDSVPEEYPNTATDAISLTCSVCGETTEIDRAGLARFDRLF